MVFVTMEVFCIDGGTTLDSSWDAVAHPAWLCEWDVWSICSISCVISTCACTSSMWSGIMQLSIRLHTSPLLTEHPWHCAFLTTHTQRDVQLPPSSPPSPSLFPSLYFLVLWLAPLFCLTFISSAALRERHLVNIIFKKHHRASL